MRRSLIKTLLGVALLAGAGLTAVTWFAFRIYVPEDRCAVLIRRMGDELPPGQMVATKPGQKGIQLEVLGPGRHFYNPLWWDYKLKPLTVIPSGDPSTWEWIHSLDKKQRDALRAGRFAFKGEFPKIGVVTRKVGTAPPEGRVLVTRQSGMKGILEEVLTPGTYKINPEVYDVQIQPAIVIPAGFVGVVTNLFGSQPAPTRTPDTPASPGDGRAEGDVIPPVYVRPLAEPGQRGTLRDVLHPGVYFINPKRQKVTLIEIGFNEYSQIKVSEDDNFRISFPSDTGYVIQVGVTVVWGIHPKHAAEIINEFGNIDRVLDKVIGPQLRSICRNIGSTYAARDFIQGEKREHFQRDLTDELQHICRGKNIEVLLALIREIEVRAPTAMPGATSVTEDLKRTIQQSHVAIERQLTNAKQRDAAAVRAQLEEERKKVEIAQESIRADTRVMVAQVIAEAEKTAAEITAQAGLEVAGIEEQIALRDAKRIEILGAANAAVEKMSKEAEAQGYELLVEALGSGHAFNLYTFAENFEPDSIRLFFAGEGTFWTDLSRFEEVGAAKMLQPTTAKAP
ncbi:MAG: SPFH domain-containing protein [Phycisphaerae bacterium]